MAAHKPLPPHGPLLWSAPHITTSSGKEMIQGPVTGAISSDSASAADVTALAAVVDTKATSVDLVAAETTINTQSGEVGALQIGVQQPWQKLLH